METEVMLGLIAIIGFMVIGGFIHWLFTTKFERGKVPDIPNIPLPPKQIYYKTIERKYGRDLLEISTRIYLEKVKIYSIDSEIKIKGSVLEASQLLNEVEKFCFEIDKAAAEKSAEEFKKMCTESEKL
jgi:hypothetical protein